MYEKKTFNSYKMNNICVTFIDDFSIEAKNQFNQAHKDIIQDEIELLFNRDPRAQFNKIDNDTFLMVIRTVSFCYNEEVEHLISIRIICHKQEIFIASENNVEELNTLLNEKSKYNFETTFDFLVELIDLTTIELEEHIYAIEDKIDIMEAKLLGDLDIKNRQRILYSRRKIIELRRHLLPQKEVMNKMTNVINRMDEERASQIYDLYQRHLRICDYLEAMRERLSLMQEEISTAINDRMNQNMYRLSIIATIFLPLGFITGLLGINVGGIPGINNHDAFWIVSIASIIIGIGIWLYFKYKKWIF